MRIRAVGDLASAVRGRRMDIGLTQADLAKRAAVSRMWVSNFEAGNPTAELGRVLRVLDALDLGIELGRVVIGPRSKRAIDLRAVIEEHRRK